MLRLAAADRLTFHKADSALRLADPCFQRLIVAPADLAEAAKPGHRACQQAIESSNLSFPNSVLADITKSHVKL